MDKKLLERVQELSGVLLLEGDNFSNINVMSYWKDGGRRHLQIIITFPGGEVYAEEFESSPNYVIDNFKYLLGRKYKRDPIKLYNMLKKASGKPKESMKLHLVCSGCSNLIGIVKADKPNDNLRCKRENAVIKKYGKENLEKWLTNPHEDNPCKFYMPIMYN